MERKAFENFVACLSDGTLAFQMQRLSETAGGGGSRGGALSALFKLEHVAGAWLADSLARLQVRYPGDRRRLRRLPQVRRGMDLPASALGDATGAA